MCGSRFGAKPIIWRELQLHNIVFTSRSAAIFYLQLLRPCYSDRDSFHEVKPDPSWLLPTTKKPFRRPSLRQCVPEHFLTRLLLVVLFHFVADRITDRYQASPLHPPTDPKGHCT
jgi:hypothetical protein